MESIELDGRTARVLLRGEYDLSNRDDLRSTLGQACRRSTGDVVVDLSETSFIDGSILDLLARVSSDLGASGRRLRVSGASAYQQRLLGLVDLSGLIADAPPDT